MLDIYPVALDIARVAASAFQHIAQHDSDLARQLRRAATSVPLNIAEGSAGIGGNRRQRYATALGSAREAKACFDLAVAMGYVPALAADDGNRFSYVIGTLVKLTR